jgi:imidazolonepropionase-like amidohydrolase
VEEGAPADLLLLDGKSLEKINSIAHSAKFKVIMKDGVIYKDALTK